MNVKIKNKTVVIEFESGQDGFGHSDVMAEIIRLLDEGIKKFVFDFQSVKISFNSSISGFIIAVSKKLVESGATIIIRDVSERDKDLLSLVGLANLGSGITYSDGEVK